MLRFLASLPGVIAVFAIYGLVHSTLRGVASPTLGQDDVIAAVFAQDWSWGYSPANPPLYDWLLGAVHSLTGPDLLAALALKYGLLTATAAFTYLAAQIVMRDRLWAALAAFSLSLCYQIGWNLHEGVTHTAVLTTLVMATLWSILRLMAHGRAADYLILGVCLGLGFLSKYNYPLLIVSLLAASIFVEPARHRLLDMRILLSVAVAALIVAPFVYWLASSGFTKSEIATRFAEHAPASYASRLATGLGMAIKSPIGFLAPFIFVVPLVFSGVAIGFGRAARSLGRDGLSSSFERLLFLQLVAAALLLVLAALAGFDQAQARYMHPLFLPAVILVMAIAKAQMRGPREIRYYAYALIGFAAVVLSVRVVHLAVGPPLCGPCRQFERFETLATALREAGLAETGVIVTDNRFIAGNLRRLMPGCAVALVGRPTFVPKNIEQRLVEPVAVVMSGKGRGDEAARDLLARAGKRLAVEAQTPAQEVRSLSVESAWTSHLWKSPGYRRSVWSVVLIPAEKAARQAAGESLPAPDRSRVSFSADDLTALSEREQ